jgi:hypothetical protein
MRTQKQTTFIQSDLADNKQHDQIFLPMKYSASILLVILAFSVCAFNVNKSEVAINRRDLFRQVASAGAAATIVTWSNPANSLDACPTGSKNCIRTTWTPPSGTDASAAASTLKKVIESYPQEGQGNVDIGGWTIVDDSFTPGKVASIEYKSGIGNFAKFFNGGKPFVDDLKLEIGDNGVVSVRSSSRVGESDLGVNQKRLSYLVSKLRAEGWDAPDPSY